MKKLFIVFLLFLVLLVGGYKIAHMVHDKYDYSEYGMLPDKYEVVREGDERVEYIMETIDESGEVRERDFTTIQPLTEESIIKLNIKNNIVHSYDVIIADDLPESVKKQWKEWSEKRGQ